MAYVRAVDGFCSRTRFKGLMHLADEAELRDVRTNAATERVNIVAKLRETEKHRAERRINDDNDDNFLIAAQRCDKRAA